MTIRFGKMIVDASTSLLVLFTFEHVPDGKSVAWFRCLIKNPSIRNKQGSVLHVLLGQGSGAVCSDPGSLSLPQRFVNGVWSFL